MERKWQGCRRSCATNPETTSRLAHVVFTKISEVSVFFLDEIIDFAQRVPRHVPGPRQAFLGVEQFRRLGPRLRRRMDENRLNYQASRFCGTR